MSHLKKILENKKSNHNLIYSDNFTKSNFFSIFTCNNVLSQNIIEIIEEIYSNDFLENINVIFNDLLFKNIMLNKKYLFVFNVVNNYLTKNIIGQVEKFFHLDDYSLNLKKIFFFEYLEDLSSKNITNLNSDFMGIINIDLQDIILEITSSECNVTNYSIKSNSVVVFCSKHNFKLKFNSQNMLLLFTINYYGGYDKYNYNEHPNNKI